MRLRLLVVLLALLAVVAAGCSGEKTETSGGGDDSTASPGGDDGTTTTGAGDTGGADAPIPEGDFCALWAAGSSLDYESEDPAENQAVWERGVQLAEAVVAAAPEDLRQKAQEFADGFKGAMEIVAANNYQPPDQMPEEAQAELAAVTSEVQAAFEAVNAYAEQECEGTTP